jgi:acid phosphatase
MAQLRELGEYLRTRYIDSGFLSPKYKPLELLVRSTAKNRALVSAQSLLVGLYPPGTGDTLPHSEGKWAMVAY